MSITEIIREKHRNGELEEMFPKELWDCPEAFNMSGIKGYEPMTAKELDTEEVQDFEMTLEENILEEKFDGTRALVYFLSQDTEDSEKVGFCRVFSRRISKKTNFYVENSDSLPQIRDINVPELDGTILDGEMFINGLPFKEVSSTLNCLWNKAVERQLNMGFISLHAFDILFYKGIDLRKMPLERRKVYLHLAVEEANSDFIEEVEYHNCGKVTDISYLAYLDRIEGADEDLFLSYLENNKHTYPNLYKCIEEETNLTPRAYYELIVATGGEGLIVKPKKGQYKHKRGWEYSKVKKFLTREMIICDFDEPTREYQGKAPNNWAYYEGDTPVTKFYYNKQVGNLILGVLITKEELETIPNNKKGRLYSPHHLGLNQKLDDKYLVMQVCECGGYDDDTREYFTRNRKRLIGSVVEVKANELFRDSGNMRHPRYMRMRFDKEAERCTWSDHIGDSEVTK